MMKKILYMILLCVLVFTFTACNAKPPVTDENGEGDSAEGGSTDKNDASNTDGTDNNDSSGDGSADGGDNSTDDNEKENTDDNDNDHTCFPDYYDWLNDICYDDTELILQLTKCDNANQLSSGCERYLEGNTNDDEDIDRYVDERNSNAERSTHLKINYTYVDNTYANYGATKNIKRIVTETNNKNQDTPDIYCNFVTDIVCASLFGSLAHIKSLTYGAEQDMLGINYFDETAPGYMTELMTSLSLSLDKLYVIASDYFIDIIRSVYIVPVNVSVFNEIAANDSKLPDYTNDGIKDINDLFEEVKDGGWTYDRVADYAAAAYKPSVPDGTDTDSAVGRLGFALAKNELSAAGMIYSSGIKIIDKHFDNVELKYDYSYLRENPELAGLAGKLSTLMSMDGIKCITRNDASAVGVTGASSELAAIRKQFASGNVLFGGITLLGSLEHPEYQQMNKTGGGGFAILPVPVYNSAVSPIDPQIHDTARVGAIAGCTAKFAQCTAFIQYQATASIDIFNEYSDKFFTYEASGALDGNLEAVQFIRENLTDSFDKVFEDATYYFYPRSLGTPANRWYALICNAEYAMSDIEFGDNYASLVNDKRLGLLELIHDAESGQIHFPQ